MAAMLQHGLYNTIERFVVHSSQTYLWRSDMALDLKFIMVSPDDPPDLNQDILGLNLDEFGFDAAAAWIKTMRQEAEARNEMLPCLVVLGTPPDETEWSQRQEWDARSPA